MASYVDLMMTSTQVGPDGSCTYFLWSEIWHAHLWVLRWAAPQAWTADVSEFGMWQNFSGHDGGGGHCSRTMLIRVSFHNFGPDSDLWTAIRWIALKFVQTWSLEDESYWFVDPLTCLLASWAHWHFCFFSFSLTCLDKHSIDCHDIFAWKKEWSTLRRDFQCVILQAQAEMTLMTSTGVIFFFQTRHHAAVSRAVLPMPSKLTFKGFSLLLKICGLTL